MLTESEIYAYFTNYMASIDKPTAHLLCQQLHERGIERIVVSPGSRCAPLVVVLDRSGYFDMKVVIDERTAAFVALGMSLASGKPVALVCTSGSAMLNYGPALAEAYYRQVPLIAITADRPARWIDQHDSQTIRQPHALDAVTRRSIDIEDTSAPDALRFANRRINEVLAAATGMPKGPVHINMQFDAPLTPVCEEEPETYARTIDIRQQGYAPFDDVIESIAPDSRVLVVAGDMAPDERLERILARPKWTLYAETQSNLSHLMPETPHAFDTAAMKQPDIVVSIGGPIVSASMKNYLRGLEGLRHISLGAYDTAHDTFGCLIDSLIVDAADFFEALAKRLDDIKEQFTKVEQQKESFFDRLVKAFPGADFHFSNGMAIRYAQSVRPTGRVYCNRGVSGIEGATSTAIGSAIASGKTTVLVSGDMSASYDIGAMAVHDIPASFRMVVLDNDGGDIFRMVSTTRRLPECEKYFTVTPRLPLEGLAKAYGFAYFEARLDDDVPEEFVRNTDAPAILRLVIPAGHSYTFMKTKQI